GAETIVNKLNLWSNELGERFKPCQALINMAETGNKYYS
ncbi:MAG: 3-hydroxyacyl-CoA dehydrogenase/enoyl-CoA hydratase/3-hydroxybutyryl-CoA epimerase, partial [Colwellia sp.]